MSNNDEDNNSANYGLLVSFTDQSPSFTNGFEAGQVWQELETTDETELVKVLHTANNEVIQRMALEKGWDVDFEPTEFEEWTTVTLSKGIKRVNRPNPHGLRVLQ